MFNYGGLKLFLLKFFFGLFLFLVSIFFIFSLLSYDVNDPGIDRFGQKSEILNLFGFAGALISSLLMLIFGHLSLLLSFYIFFISIIISTGIRSNKLFIKLILIILSITLINFSASLQKIEIIKTGFLSNFMLDIFIFYYP